MCDRVAIIDRGKVKACGTLDEMRTLLDDRKRYLIELDNPAQELIEGMKDVFPFTVGETSPGGGITIEVSLDDRWTVSRVIEGIVTRGGKVTACTPKGRSLEEIFSRVTSDRESGE
jgi:ABC-type multidrug transport system ATPase subunit